MAEGVRGGASWWNIASAVLAFGVARGVFGIALNNYPPSLWVAVPLLLGGLTVAAWWGTWVKPTPSPYKRGLRRDAESWRAALQVWSWGNYPFLIAFVCWLLAIDEFERLYGFGQAMLILAASVAPSFLWGAFMRRKRAHSRVAGESVV